MASALSTPQLSQGNHIYLYQLLKKELGCGKQTFLPRVEEALATDGLSAELMGFSNTRELLEALGDFVALTVFKGGRVYATVLSQPDWDAAAKPAGKAGTGTGAKSWKRKKSGKDVKPVRPTCVKPIEPEPEPEPEPQPEPEMTLEPEPEHEAAPEAAMETASAVTPEPRPLPETAVELQPEIESDQEESLEAAAEPEAVHEHNAPAAQIVPEPTISLTVTYDPSSEDQSDEQESALHETPTQRPVECEASVQIEALETPTSTPPRPFTPAELDGYPLDLSRDVFCPGDVLSELTRLLPLGADVLGIANEYYYIAGEQGTLEAGRTHAAFPLRFTRDGERYEVTIRMKRRPNSHPGASWVICGVSYPEN